MYPIQREDYIKAYTAAISEEMQQSRRHHTKTSSHIDAFDRFHRTIVRMLHRDVPGPPRAMNPLPH